MRDALATLPWVEQDSIQADVAKKEVRFAVKDRDKFDAGKVKRAVRDNTRFKDVEVLSGP